MNQNNLASWYISLGALSFAILSIFFIVYHASELHLIPSFLNDQVHYIGLARHLVDYGAVAVPGKFHGTGNIIYPSLLNLYHPRLYVPGFFATLALSFWLFGVSTLSAILPSMFSFFMSTLLLFYIARKLYSQRVAFVATVLFMFTPVTIFYSFTAMSEMFLTFICLASFALLVRLPQKYSGYFIPLLIIVPFMVKQTSILMLMPMLAYAYDSQSLKKIWKLCLVLLISLFMLRMLTVWQIHAGLVKMPYEDFLREGHVNYDNAFSHTGTTPTLLQWINLLLNHAHANFLTIVAFAKHNPTLQKLTTPSFYIGISMTLVALIYGIHKRKESIFPFAVGAMSLASAGICIVLYNGAPNVIIRMSLFCVSYLSIAVAAMLYDNTVRQSQFFRWLQNARWIVVAVFVFLSLHGNMYSAKYLRENEVRNLSFLHLMESVNPDYSQVIIAPGYLAPPGIYKHYPTLYSFVPGNDETLILLNKKFPVGTIMLNESDSNYHLTEKAIHQIGLMFVGKKEYKDGWWLIYKRLASEPSLSQG